VPLSAVAPRVDAVLLSHGDIAHLGALPTAFARCGLRRGTPVCATTPVAKMGQLTLYDLFAARHGDGEFDAFTLDDVDAAFASVQHLKYTQTLTLARTDGRTPVAVAPFAAGHTLGGALWRITAGAEEVVYAVDWNNRGERHLPPAALGAFARPSLLIMDATSALAPPPPPRRDSERALCDACVACLRADGCALLPCDAAGRTLEVVLSLEAHWAANPGLGNYRVVLLTACAHSTMEFAASQLEWMSEAVARGFERNRDNPFALRHVTPVSSLDALDALPPGPKVVLASLASLAAGAARALLARWAPDPRCMLLFTGPGQEATLARARLPPRRPSRRPRARRCVCSWGAAWCCETRSWRRGGTRGARRLRRMPRRRRQRSGRRRRRNPPAPRCSRRV
jgi:cleavage and polyadenylation specificity factor subunit 2